MDKEQVAQLYMKLHERWEKARRFREAKEPETHENGFYQGMEYTYAKLMEELSIYEMVEIDGAPEKEAVETTEGA